jgi:UDP-N-acetylmuramoyl-tripeptide--D-alanyl-D-alanine ligase
MEWTREEILMATGGELVREGKERIFGEIVTDSRSVAKGSVFIALQGDRLDGHSFLVDSVRCGASCLVVHRKPLVRHLRDAAVIRVRDTRQALGDLAHHRRDKVSPKVLAITGSNGKTTTKEMVAAILQRATVQGDRLRGKVLKTEGNYNNLVGLPITLLRLQKRQRVAVLELGTSRPGEIRRLTEIADPDIGLITSVQPAHLTGLNNLAGVAREKGDLFRRMHQRGIAVVNLDDPYVRRLAGKFKGRRITYGRGGEVTGENWNAVEKGGIQFTLCVMNRRRRVRLRLSGEHNLINAVGAAAMAYGLGADIEAMGKGLEAVRPMPMRMRVETWTGIGIIDDAYNANPASMEAALKTLAGVGGKGDTVAILGDMLEMGSERVRSHLELGKVVARFGIDRLYLLGEEAGHVRRGALLGGMDEKRVIIGRSHGELAGLIRERTKRGDWLLFKGSRGLGMEKVLKAFKESGD